MNFTMGPTHQTPILNLTTSNATSNANHSTINNIDSFTTEGILKAFAVAILIVISIAGNLVVCISFTMFRNLRSITNYFLVSLSISDILISLCAMPFWMMTQLYQPRLFISYDQVTLRMFWKVMDFFLCLSSVLILAVIAVERNLAISRPFYYTKWVSPVRVYVTIAAIWMIALTISVITSLNPFGKRSILSIFIVCTSYVIPLFTILAMYTQILLVARRQARRLRQDGALAKDMKAIKTIAIVIGAFFVCYTPFMVVIIWVHFAIGPIALYTVSIAKWLTYFNSCINPIIYSCFNKTYRRGFKRLFQHVTNKLHEFRVRIGDRRANAARKLQRSRLSVNLTMRSSAGSLLDSLKMSSAAAGGTRASVLSSAGGQSRASAQSVSQVAANCVEPGNNRQIPISCDVHRIQQPSSEPAENVVQDTEQ